MSRPGTRLRAIAAYLCDARTMERVVDPTVSDLQTEYQDAVSRGRRLETARIWIAGHIALIQVIALQASLRTVQILRDLAGDDRRAVLRTIVASATIAIASTLAIALLPLVRFVSVSHPRSVLLALYLVPQAIPWSILIGLTFGVLWGLGRMSTSRATGTVVLLFAAGASMASFTLAAWVVPAANQAFRVSMSHGRPIARGVSELTLGEIRQQLKSRTPRLAAGAANSLAVNYHLRWALGSAPFVLTLFTVALMSRRQWGRMIPLLVGCLVVLTYPFMMYSTGRLELHQTISPLAAAWTPNAAFLALSLAIVMFTSRRTNAIPHA